MYKNVESTNSEPTISPDEIWYFQRLFYSKFLEFLICNMHRNRHLLSLVQILYAFFCLQVDSTFLRSYLISHFYVHSMILCIMQIGRYVGLKKKSKFATYTCHHSTVHRRKPFVIFLYYVIIRISMQDIIPSSNQLQ